MLIAPAVAQTTRPATSNVEALPVIRARSTTGTAVNTGIDWQRIVIATVVVLGLIVALRYAAVWLLPSARAGSGRGVRVLGRTAIAPRQQVVLLHVGRRVVVVGDSAGTLSSLAVITEPDEVAELLGQAATTPTPTRFGSLFGRAGRQYDESPETMTAADDPDAAKADPAVAAAEDEIADLRERMKALAKTVGR